MELSSPPSVHKSTSVINAIFPLVFLIAGFLIAGGIFYAFPLRSKIVEKPVVKQVSLSLPSDAVQISGCIPHMGEHWARLSDLYKGWFYLVEKGRVVGLEYMFKESDIPNNIGAHMKKEAAQKYAIDNKLTFSQAVDMAIPGHIDFPENTPPIKTWDLEWSAPHTGLLEPHYDAHFYFVNQTEVNNICPDAPFTNDLPGDMRNELERLGVPIP